MSQWNPRRSRGARLKNINYVLLIGVSVEPPPKQGCEGISITLGDGPTMSQWNPRRSRGARWRLDRMGRNLHRLSGTPAEAGVREENARTARSRLYVSVEPPPTPEHIDIACRIGAFIHPPAILFDFCDFKEHLCDSTSNSYCLSSGSTSIHPPIRFFVAHRVFHSA